MRKVLASAALALLPLMSAAQQVDTVVAVAVDWSDYQWSSTTPASLDKAAKNMAALVAEGSGGKHVLNIRTHPTVVTVPLPRPAGKCIRPNDADLAAALTAAGVDFSGIKFMVLLMRPSLGGCNGGYSSLMWGTVSGTRVDRLKIAVTSSTNYFVVGHEMAHGMELGHARSISCGCFPLGRKCSVNEYGNAWDITGKSSYTIQTQAANRARLGWIVPAVYTSGTVEYRLAPAYTPHQTLPNALRIDLPASTLVGDGIRYDTPIRLWVEWRKPVGFDAKTDPTFASGVMVNIVGSWTSVLSGRSVTNSKCDNYGPCLLDMTPGDDIVKNRGLQPGKSWTDPVHGVKIEVIGIENDTMVVRVSGRV